MLLDAVDYFSMCCLRIGDFCPYVAKHIVRLLRSVPVAVPGEIPDDEVVVVVSRPGQLWPLFTTAPVGG